MILLIHWASNAKTRYRQYLVQSANALKDQSKSAATGREQTRSSRGDWWNDLETNYGSSEGKVEIDERNCWCLLTTMLMRRIPVGRSGPCLFAGLYLSPTAGAALGKANFVRPSPIQAAAIPSLARASR
jgi:hypothetical protein